MLVLRYVCAPARHASALVDDTGSTSTACEEVDRESVEVEFGRGHLAPLVAVDLVRLLVSVGSRLAPPNSEPLRFRTKHRPSGEPSDELGDRRGSEVDRGGGAVRPIGRRYVLRSRCPVFVGLVLVVVVEPGRKQGQDGFGVGKVGHVDVVALDGLHESLGHAVGFGGIRGRVSRQQPACRGERTRVVRRVRRAIVGEPLHVAGGSRRFETSVDRQRDEVADVCAVEMSVSRDPPDGFSIAAVEAEGDVDLLAVPTLNLEHVAAPAHVAGERDDLAVVQQVGFGAVSLKQHLRLAHDPVDPPVVHRRLVCVSPEMRGDTPIAARGRFSTMGLMRSMSATSAGLTSRCPGADFVFSVVERFEKIGRYQLVCLLGGGGMGEVWSVVDPELGTAKALKILRPSLGWDEQYRVLFAREAKVAAQLGRHPGFPAIHDFDASGDLPYLVMDYIDGVNLRALAKAGGLNEGQAVQVMRALFRALVIAHGNRRGSSEANVVHGDIKPENIMVSSHGDVFLTDFGISRFVEGRVVTSSIIGTIPYMAPEAFDGVVCVQGDLFAAGLILHELLCGERVHPKGATVLDVKKAYKRGVPPLGVAVHPELENLRQMLLQVDVDDRLVSAEDALEILKRVEVVDRRDELADLYRRLIGPPHTGLTQYLQSADTPGSFLPEYFGERDSMGEEEPATVSVGVGALAGEIEPDGPGHTVAIPDDELLAARQGGGAFRKGEIEQLDSPEALIPTPSHVVHAGTEPVEFETPMDVQEPGRGENSRQRWWMMLAAVLLASVGGGSAIGYVLFGLPGDDDQPSGRRPMSEIDHPGRLGAQGTSTPRR